MTQDEKLTQILDLIGFDQDLENAVREHIFSRMSEEDMAKQIPVLIAGISGMSESPVELIFKELASGSFICYDVEINPNERDVGGINLYEMAIQSVLIKKKNAIDELISLDENDPTIDTLVDQAVALDALLYESLYRRYFESLMSNENALAICGCRVFAYFDPELEIDEDDESDLEDFRDMGVDEEETKT